jgi:hypothetical protein
MLFYMYVAIKKIIYTFDIIKISIPMKSDTIYFKYYLKQDKLTPSIVHPCLIETVMNRYILAVDF